MAPNIATAKQWARAVLQAGGYPVTASNEQALIRWSSYEAGPWGTTQNTTSERNPISTSLGEPGSKAFNNSQVQSYPDWESSIRATIAMFNQPNMSSIREAFHGGDALRSLPQALANAQWAGTAPGPNQAYSKTIAGVFGEAPGGTVAQAASAPVPPTTFAAPLPDVNVHNFHGFDLSAIPSNEIGNAERSVEKYITDPGYAQRLQQRIQQDYGYSSWAEKIPQLNGVLIWAASNIDLSTAAGQNAFLGAVQDTTWWKTTSENQRAWEAVQGTDPAKAHEALIQAQDKVLATANQLGVRLSKHQLDSIASTYAAQSYTPTGVLGAQSGTSQEWLDQAVVGAVTSVAKGQPVTGATPFEQQNPSDLFGISSQLYNQFQQIAQQYLMYNPNGKGLLTSQDLMDYVDGAIKNWTGSNSFGSSNLINGAVQNFTQQMMAKASQMYPSLAGPIAQGTTPQAYTQPEANLIANTLGLDPQSINFTDPNWNWAIASPDPKTNTKVALTQDQILQKITNPNFSFQGPNGQTMTYDNTNSAMQNARAVTNSLSSMFGIGGT